MAILKVINEKYEAYSDLNQVIKYVTNISKSSMGAGYNVLTANADMVYDGIQFVQEQSGKLVKTRAKQLILAFSKEERIDDEKAYYIGMDASKLFSNHYQVIWSVHVFGNHGEAVLPHVHLLINPVSFNGYNMLGSVDYLRSLLDLLRQHTGLYWEPMYV